MLFDGDDELFKHLAADCRIYVEYGCGSSTEWVYHNSRALIFAVDTSVDWSQRMQSQLDPQRATVQHIDVGPVGDWGYPQSFSHRHAYRDYCEWPWRHAAGADLVLVDGRFRIACFLTALKMARPGTVILFDDYANRPFYHVVEQWCRPRDRCGRQALFEVSQQHRFTVRDQDIAEFTNVVG